MKRNIKFLLGIGVMFLFLVPRVEAQILQTQSEVIKEYGEPFSSGVTKKGENYLFYKIPITTKSSGTYNQGKVLYFKTGDDGTETCYKFKVIEPNTETASNEASFTRHLVEVGEREWKDHAKGIVYKLEEVKGVCKITAWYDNSVDLVKIYKF